MERLGISRRTLFRDLDALKEAGIPYYYERGGGYRIARSFFLPPVDLQVTETLGLMFLARHAEAWRRQPLVGPALSALRKLAANVPESMREACLDLMSHVSVDAGPAPADHETAVYAVCVRCIEERLVCRMTYRSPIEPPGDTLEVHPYALHFASRGWYLMAHSPAHAEVRLFKLARIQEMTPTERHFDRPANFKVQDKIGKAWRLIPEGRVAEIELVFSARVGTNVHEVRWHPSQRSELLPDGRCRVLFEVDGFGEIAWWLCGYADQVTIVRPPELRSLVREMTTAAARHHDGA